MAPCGRRSLNGGRGLPQMQQHRHIDGTGSFCIPWFLPYDVVRCVNSQQPPHAREVKAACGERAGVGHVTVGSRWRPWRDAGGRISPGTGRVRLGEPLSHGGSPGRPGLRPARRRGRVRDPLPRPDQSAGRVRGADADPAPAVVGRGRALRRVRQPDRRLRGGGVSPDPARGRQPDRRRRHLLVRHEAGPGPRIRGPRPALADRPGHARPVRAPQAAAPPAAPRDMHPPRGGGGPGARGDRDDHGPGPGLLPWPVHRGGVRAGRPAAPRTRSRASPCPAGWTA